MKTLIYWTWVFGFAILNHLSKYNKDSDFFIYWRDLNIKNYLKKNKKHPLFFEDTILSDNFFVVDELDKEIGNVDLLIMSIPAEFVVQEIEKIKKHLKKWVMILSLSKWIDNINLKTIWESLKESIWEIDYKYSVLSWWMIASELVWWNYMWADLAVDDLEVWEKIKSMFLKWNLDIKIVLNNTKAVELYWALKNIIAICIWYYQAKWYDASTIWYFLCKLYDELEFLMKKFWTWSLWFSNYSLGWDLIASCFWNSRNREFWKMLWEWKWISEILNILKENNKISEWYYTFKWIYKITKSDHNFIELNKLWAKIFEPNNIEK